jgi:predicted signal transduction protein with EAL and GGDEF domain
VNGTEVFVTSSIGIATYPADGATAEVLLRNADTAMYHAKQQGKAAYQYYSEEMNAASVERLTLESGLRHALDEDRLELHYQPQIDGASGRIVGAEALLRWRDPVRGFISPETFIPIAEDAGLNPPHGCRMGICHTCNTTLKSGCVRDLRTGQLLNEAGAIVQTCVCAAAGDCELDL